MVILIIGILAAIALPAFLGQRQKGQDATAKSNARNMASALESCYATAESYASCDTSQDVVASGIPTGTGSNQVNLALDNFEIAAQSASRNNFTIAKPSGGTVSRTCTTTSQGACPDSGSCSAHVVDGCPREKPPGIKEIGALVDPCRERPGASAFRGGWHQTIQTSPQKEETNAAEAQ